MNIGRAAAVLAASTALVAGTALAASAITGGERDGNGHSNVALITFYAGGRLSTCTATLVSPTVLLTAGHCTAGVSGSVGATFDPVIAEEPAADGSPPVPVASDPAAGYTDADLEVAGYLTGTADTHPGYSGFTDPRNWNDVGVVVLDQPVDDVTPAPLAPEGYLDQLTPAVLHDTLFTAVGFGTEVRQAEAGPQKPTPQPFPFVRRVAQVPGQKLTAQILQVNGNEKDPRGTGGTCLGDSGGPSFLHGFQVTVTSYSNTPNCRYIAGFQRVDIPVVQEWLATLGVAPAG
ncbi:MAG TPA: trypsin-like serine protease [Pedococcus sp.]|jgi:hypothetical protein|uniref:trypsin-like serine protease n=1 Tax=Pedococcus sp. TaxID=2860345 RepID=UPI002F95D75C